jgi:hypothetical protein
MAHQSGPTLSSSFFINYKFVLKSLLATMIVDMVKTLRSVQCSKLFFVVNIVSVSCNQ